jgi:hypothetical protein
MIRNFGIRLGWTDPKALFDKGTWKNNGLHDRMDTCAWTGAYLYFGAPWKNTKSWVTEFNVQTAMAKATEATDEDDEDDEEKQSSSPDTDVAKNTELSGR